MYIFFNKLHCKKQYFRTIQPHTALTQGISRTFIDQMPTVRLFRSVYYTGFKIFNSLPHTHKSDEWKC